MEFKLFFEAREGLLNYLRSRLSDVPSYVLYDLYYRSVKNMNRVELEEFLQDHGNIKWNLVKDFRIDPKTTFDDDTLRVLSIRDGGKSNPYDVPKDLERHVGAMERIESKGMPTEPIILIKSGDKYELVEGWHRTMQLLNLYPDGYIYPNVYIGTR
jgi:hypothetical protein